MTLELGPEPLIQQHSSLCLNYWLSTSVMLLSLLAHIWFRSGACDSCEAVACFCFLVLELGNALLDWFHGMSHSTKKVLLGDQD
uniref:Uncharacterized protein n=1 Tax=Arundo donax TaxID=35708 RepID=A0A0A9HGF9_ARUDO